MHAPKLFLTGLFETPKPALVLQIIIYSDDSKILIQQSLLHIHTLLIIITQNLQYRASPTAFSASGRGRFSRLSVLVTD